MTALQETKSWSINPNVRNAYTTMVDMSGWFIYQNHAWLKAHGWTVKFTSNGVTGPSGPTDHTDRMISNAAGSVRATVAGAAQSYTVLTSSDGVDLMFTFQGASDDVIRMSYSPGGLFVLAGTTTFQPTATDEVIFVQGASIVNGTVGLDRVMTIWASDDGTAWSNLLWRNSAFQSGIGFEKCVNLCYPGVFDKPYIAYRFNAYTRSFSPGGNGPVYDPLNVSPGAVGWLGSLARIYTDGAFRTTRLGAGTIVIPNIPNSGTNIEDVFLTATPALQGGTMPCFPWIPSGEKAGSLDGLLGYPYDWWIGYTNLTTSPFFNDVIPGYAPGDVPGVDPTRTNWFIVIGPTMIRPWHNVAAAMLVA
jgi:hypothetical protein